MNKVFINGKKDEEYKTHEHFCGVRQRASGFWCAANAAGWREVLHASYLWSTQATLRTGNLLQALNKCTDFNFTLKGVETWIPQREKTPYHNPVLPTLTYKAIRMEGRSLAYDSSPPTALLDSTLARK
jgi:hypothetical protein